ncbi:MAG: hypothetical protein J7L86_08285 [Candidatus Marinimicrobia bacterium]|nr:hypothetical protein [Candidatus Neomarinimicrobiota bacterium]
MSLLVGEGQISKTNLAPSLAGLEIGFFGFAVRKLGCGVSRSYHVRHVDYYRVFSTLLCFDITGKLDYFVGKLRCTNECCN